MAEPQYAHNHVINPETGFLENPAYASQFDSTRKLAFLNLYKNNGLRLRRACREMGLSDDTIHRHINIDPVFKKMFDDVTKDHLEELESVSATNSLNPRSVIERIFRLKCLLPEKYGQENRPAQTNITINFDPQLLETVRKRSEIIDITSTQVEQAQTVDSQADRVPAITDNQPNECITP